MLQGGVVNALAGETLGVCHTAIVFRVPMQPRGRRFAATGGNPWGHKDLAY